MSNENNRVGMGTETRPFLKKYYLQKDLERMTTYQLREICFEQRLAKSIISPLDKNEIIRLIMRYRGLEENSLIKDYDEEGISRLEDMLNKVNISVDYTKKIKGPSTIVAYDGLRMDYLDDFAITFDEQFAQTNALLIGANNQLCGIFNIERFGNKKDFLYLTKSSYSFMRQAENKHYSLYFFNKHLSEIVYRIYTNPDEILPNDIKVNAIPILDFQIKSPLQVDIPLAIDFGSSNTAAAVSVDETIFHSIKSDIKSKFYEDDVHYVSFIDTTTEDYLIKPMIPSVVGVIEINGEDNIEYAFGYDALKVADLSLISEGFCIFHDIKRWVTDLDRVEELIDRNGSRAYVSRKEIISKFMSYVLEVAEQRFKSRFTRVVMPYPIKQKQQFQELTYELFTEHRDIEVNNVIDESVAVIYNTMDSLIKNDNYVEDNEYSALVLDCGGGTTNLSSCTFTINNDRISYKIDINTSYENGDADFGGNNLTFIIMKYLKICLAKKLTDNNLIEPNEIIESFDKDIYRYIDEFSIEELYSVLDAEYEKAETIVPTKFKNFEYDTKEDYFRVKNNFYFLFNLAENIKCEFFNKLGTLKILLTDLHYEDKDITLLQIDRWKVSFFNNGKLETVRKFPNISINSYDIHHLLKGAVYNLFKRFFERIYENDELLNYSIIKLTGLSCKIDIFKDSLKEFIPGKIVQFKKQSKDITDNYELKLGVLRGVVNYIKSKEYGFANFNVINYIASLPFIITVDTHTGNQKTLIHSLDKHSKKGNISRSMDKLTLKLYLKDTDENTRCEYIYNCNYDDFVLITYDEIYNQYGEIILQEDTDSIVSGEVKFFVWADDDRWGFHVLSVLRKDGDLMLGQNKFFSFESDLWVKNFFDGLK